LGVGDPADKNRSRSESAFEIIKWLIPRGIEISRNIFSSQLD